MKRILVVDDDAQVARTLRAALQSSRYKVTVASDGCEGFEQVKSENPDPIITVLAMPAMDGLELTSSVRRFSSTPVIMLSVHDRDTLKITALDEGADDDLTEPFIRRSCRRGDAIIRSQLTHGGKQHTAVRRLCGRAHATGVS